MTDEVYKQLHEEWIEHDGFKWRARVYIDKDIDERGDKSYSIRFICDDLSKVWTVPFRYYNNPTNRVKDIFNGQNYNHTAVPELLKQFITNDTNQQIQEAA